MYRSVYRCVFYIKIGMYLDNHWSMESTSNLKNRSSNFQYLKLLPLITCKVRRFLFSKLALLLANFDSIIVDYAVCEIHALAQLRSGGDKHGLLMSVINGADRGNISPIWLSLSKVHTGYT